MWAPSRAIPDAGPTEYTSKATGEIETHAISGIPITLGCPISLSQYSSATVAEVPFAGSSRTSSNRAGHGPPQDHPCIMATWGMSWVRWSGHRDCGVGLLAVTVRDCIVVMEVSRDARRDCGICRSFTRASGLQR